MIAKGVYHFRQAGNNFSTGRDGGCAGFGAFYWLNVRIARRQVGCVGRYPEACRITGRWFELIGFSYML